ncbi:MAG: hypothetical protein P0119_05440 [Nitrospira sp.]|nr:hypothetical protein [Nitrospira sp.]
MTTAAFHYPLVNLLGYAGPSSQDAVLNFLPTTFKDFELPASRQKRKEAIDSVMDAYAESRQGGEIAPISELTCKETIDFLRKLPSTLPIPEVIIEPNGDLALEWFVSNYCSFLVGFSGKGVITYAGLFGRGQKTYGTEFISEAIPSSIVENIRRVLS